MSFIFSNTVKEKKPLKKKRKNDILIQQGIIFAFVKDIALPFMTFQFFLFCYHIEFF